MAQGIVGRIVTKFQVKKAKKVTNNAFNKALKEVAAEMEKAMKSQMKKRYPPHSRPGGIPHVGPNANLRNSIRVTASRGSIKVRSVNYGVFLETGTSNMRPRPWARRILFTPTRQKKWANKIAKRSLQLTGGRAKRSR